MTISLHTEGVGILNIKKLMTMHTIIPYTVGETALQNDFLTESE